MSRLKYVIFSLRNVIVKYDKQKNTGNIDQRILDELGKLAKFLRKKDIEPVVFANKDWRQRESGRSCKNLIDETWGRDIRYIITTNENMPPKPTKEAIPALLEKLACVDNEVLFIGNTIGDMRTAVNGGVVFLNAIWFGEECNYGFKFTEPKEIAKFIDTFFCRKHLWSFTIESDELRYYSLAPYGTRGPVRELYGDYSIDARQTTKEGLGHPEFWGKYLCATLLLSGIYKEIDYICPYPSHNKNEWKDPLKNSIDTFEKCFRDSYLRDLLIRHTTCDPSHQNRALANHLKQLNTLKINKKPTLLNGKKVRREIIEADKTVLVVDDFCTSGYSLEAARLYLTKIGLKVILFSLLKTIRTDYIQIKDNKYPFDPYEANDWSNAPIRTSVHEYADILTDTSAYLEFGRKFKNYDSWDW